ncbi:hypothetical protein J6590_015567 [Homalodisca vitripennis]|nr:hypothetical protein J6590_015567 [Homalodisca vitripennis]
MASNEAGSLNMETKISVNPGIGDSNLSNKYWPESDFSQGDLDGDSEENIKIGIVNQVSKEIFENAFSLIYKKYFDDYYENQTVYFVSHCSRLAWKALVKLNYQRKDNGYRKIHVDYLDTEPGVSVKDCWAGHSVPTAKKPPRVSNHGDPPKSKSTLLSDVGKERSTSDVDLESVKGPELPKILLQTERFQTFDHSMARKVPTHSTRVNTFEYYLKGHMPLPPAPILYFPPAKVELHCAILSGTIVSNVKKLPEVKTIRINKNNISYNK